MVNNILSLLQHSTHNHSHYSQRNVNPLSSRPLGSLDAQRRAHDGCAHETIHSSNAMSGKKARARKKKS
jgi:hypothetical protein